MLRRIFGILTFRRPTYLEVAKNRSVTGQAVILVTISSLLYGVIGSVVVAGDWASAWRGKAVHVIGRAAALFLSQFVGWIIIAALLVLAARLFRGQTTLGEMLRITGFVEVFTIPAVLCGVVLIMLGADSAVDIGLFILGVLALGGYVVGLVEASGITTGKALAACLVSGLVGMYAATLVGDLLVALMRIPVAD